jgi:hypothetical protein
MTKVDLISNFELVKDWKGGMYTFKEKQSKLTFDAFFDSKKNLSWIKYEQWVKNGITLVNYIETKYAVKSIDDIKSYIKNSLGPLKK